MSSDSFIYLTTWLFNTRSLLDFLINIVDFSISNTSWIDIETGSEEMPFNFLSMKPPGQEKSVRFDRKIRKDLENAQKEINKIEPEVIRVSLLGNWLDPYVVGDDLLRNWVIYIEVSNDHNKKAVKSIKIHFGYCSRWFTLIDQTQELYYETGYARDTINKGFTLNKGDYISPKFGQCYIAQEEILQKNRLSILDGIVALINEYNPKALVLAYDFAVFDWESNSVSFQHKPNTKYPPPLFYGDSNIKKAIELYEEKELKYFESKIGNSTFYLEESHFGFIRD